MLKVQEKNLKAARGKQFLVYKEASVSLIANFSSETIRDQNAVDDMFKY